MREELASLTQTTTAATLLALHSAWCPAPYDPATAQADPVNACDCAQPEVPSDRLRPSDSFTIGLISMLEFPMHKDAHSILLF
mmetsp:Transcript_44184/g.99367  ORF Transcript_44184/g.99367 Transcript_44184/m.99367 type:complete len:83 (+) Transcript_44184:282-530(+)